MDTNTSAVHPSQQLTVVQRQYLTLEKAKGFDSFVKLFEMFSEPEQAKALAEKEAYHLAQLMADNETLAGMPPTALVMEMRKIPLQGVTLDPALGLAYLIVQDKNAGKVSLEITGRGKAVQGIAQNIITNVDTAVIKEGDEIVRENGLNIVVPKFKPGAKVIGCFITITWPGGRITQDSYDQSDINGWQTRSAKRFFGKANVNYTSYNGGIEPGFMRSKALKHKLGRLGISPFPNAYRKLKPEQIEALPDDLNGQQVFTEDGEAEVMETAQPQPETQSDNDLIL